MRVCHWGGFCSRRVQDSQYGHNRARTGGSRGNTTCAHPERGKLALHARVQVGCAGVAAGRVPQRGEPAVAREAVAGFAPGEALEAGEGRAQATDLCQAGDQLRQRAKGLLLFGTLAEQRLAPDAAAMHVDPVDRGAKDGAAGFDLGEDCQVLLPSDQFGVCPVLLCE